MESKIIIQKPDEDTFVDLSIFLLLFRGLLKHDLYDFKFDSASSN